jgi:hypothetical protein
MLRLMEFAFGIARISGSEAASPIIRKTGSHYDLEYIVVIYREPPPPE